MNCTSLNPDEAASDDNGIPKILGGESFVHGQGVLSLPKAKNVIKICPFDGQVNGGTTSGQNELIIGEGLLFPGLHLNDGDRLILPVDGLGQGPVQDFDSFDILKKRRLGPPPPACR
jgi:hypothetical protein